MAVGAEGTQALGCGLPGPTGQLPRGLERMRPREECSVATVPVPPRLVCWTAPTLYSG